MREEVFVKLQIYSRFSAQVSHQPVLIRVGLFLGQGIPELTNTHEMRNKLR